MEQTNQAIELKVIDTKAPEVSTLKAAVTAPDEDATSSPASGKMSNASKLANFLPTGTLVTFETMLPLVYRTGECSRVNVVMISILLGICIFSCLFFHFTDSFFVGRGGEVKYGVVTPRGLWVPQQQLGTDQVRIPTDEKYKLGWTDVLHALMSVMVFVTIALSDHRVINCLVNRHRAAMIEVMESLPVMVFALFSALFLMFPKDRRGVGFLV